jgi:Dullard-like phosphatase family protein
LSKDLEKCIYSIQYYSTINIKNSEIKIFGDVINQIIHSIDIKTLNQFVIIFLDSIIYSELEENHKKVESAINQNNIKNIICNNDIKDSVPFLPNINPKYKYTLVLDMDETLVHFFFTKNLGMFFIRPYCFDFLNKLKEYYEIITFTAGTKEYADYILNLLDPNNEIIKYRLYRQHVTISGCSVYKDLTKIGRNLNKVIIIDNMKDNFKMQPNNGLYIKTWINDMNDYQFKDLLKILIDIVALNVMDVRLIIEKINQKINRENNLINPYYNINIEKLINEIKI